MRHCGVWSLHLDSNCRWCPRCGAVRYYMGDSCSTPAWVVPDPTHDSRKNQPAGPGSMLARARHESGI